MISLLHIVITGTEYSNVLCNLHTGITTLYDHSVYSGLSVCLVFWKFWFVAVQECGPLMEPGMVINVLDKSFDVLVLKYGVVVRVYCEVILNYL